MTQRICPGCRSLDGEHRFDETCSLSTPVLPSYLTRPTDTKPPASEQRCGACYRCLDHPELGPFQNPVNRQMIVCPECGNKRCPKATHHNNNCTHSNEPGQLGSRYVVANALGVSWQGCSPPEPPPPAPPEQPARGDGVRDATFLRLARFVCQFDARERRRGGIAGQGFTEWRCLICDTEAVHANTATPRVCATCHQKYGDAPGKDGAK